MANDRCLVYATSCGTAVLFCISRADGALSVELVNGEKKEFDAGGVKTCSFNASYFSSISTNEESPDALGDALSSSLHN